MNSKTKYIIVVLVAIAVVVGVRFYFGGPEDNWICDKTGTWVKHGNPSASMPTTICLRDYGDTIKLITPTADDKFSSNMTIRGKATKEWFLNGNFPIKTLDNAGWIVTQGVAVPEGEPDALGFVNFSSKVMPFSSPTLKWGKIVLWRDNDSGRPEDEMSVTLPIKYK